MSILTAAMLSVAMPVLANNDDQDLAAYNRQDYTTAFKIWSELANQGNAVTQHNLGVMYEQGQGVAQNYQQAVQWYQKAANQGHAKAQGNLGYMYKNGLGVAQNLKQARYWYTKAANQTADEDARENAKGHLETLK
ncbi:tetratricopeptide repeat protein [Kingella negevensis]|uniref:tetratricopeptide repeat protein n=1 Tax=Kingella negevensis TaxID=1522312 RepID=UPI002549F594|nr:tetratricopeptide repeat protein [Kingella negevensis]MDK4684235.1 tetratricopeptide repeat protein [Kingella negevensis]MDK4698159.1 tetratricopeptide repeat protein [Kingella negevensis]MDK4707220.1 tetratricopeptide repeat protein [Kingella negevensis]MDK4710798.1 tetratricopeptide repeat protein [Kingella negevensis]